MLETAVELIAAYEVVVIGAGLAGMMAAAAFVRKGINVLLLDSSASYPKTFKAEKLGNDHAAHLRRLGMLDAILPVATPIREMLIAYHGTRIARTSVEHYGIPYHDFINTVRRRLPSGVNLQIARVRKITTGPDRQQIALEDGRIVDCRLIVLASGRSHDLFAQLGLRNEMVSRMHSLSFGFTVEREGGEPFDFDELTYWGDRQSADMPYATFFRIGDAMRANVFAYWNQGDDRTRAFLDDPAGRLNRAMPGLERVMGRFQVVDQVESCPLHLQAVAGHLQPGVVVIGDAFRTVCPAAGTGVVKVLNDVDCLCAEHVPRWLASPGMGIDKISQYYSFAKKTSYDTETLRMSFNMRKTGIDKALRWRLRRTARTLKRSANALRVRWLQQGYRQEQLRSQTCYSGR